MTTEILRNALFHKQEVKDFQIDIDTELACVVFDEVHYINDADRGKVWEETIMMLLNIFKWLCSLLQLINLKVLLIGLKLKKKKMFILLVQTSVLYL